jgi:hypothetical protein
VETQETEEVDPDILLDEPKRTKRQKQKKHRPDLWSDDRFDDETDDEFDTRRRNNRRKREDWYEDWDE